MRPICQSCNQSPRAVAYHSSETINYRTLSENCIKRKKRIPLPVARWKSSGYKKKPTCDQCGFRSKYAAHLLVYHVDGNLNNNNILKLKTVCLNCTVEITKADLTWRPGDLEPDH